MKYLIEKGADIDKATASVGGGGDPLIIARNITLSVFRILSISPQYHLEIYNDAILHTRYCWFVMKLLIFKQERTPLFLAVRNDNLNIMKYLIENGAGISYADKVGGH